MVDIGSAVGYLLLDTTGFQKGFKSAFSDMKSFMDKSNKLADRTTALGSAMTKTGSALTKYVTLPLVGAGVALGNFSLGFENSMAKVSTIADTTQVPLEDLEKQIVDLSNETGVAAGDIAQNVYDAISAGQQTGDAVAFVGNATKLATAGFTSSSAALDVLTTTLNAYGLASEDAAHVSDVLITTQNLGKTTVDELSQSIGKLIPVANANGVSVEQLGTAYSILTANGIATAESTTYLKAMFNELGKSGTDVSDIIKSETGKSFQDLMNEGTSLGEVISILQQHANDTGVGLSDLFSSVEAGSAALTLASKGAEGYNDILNQMVNSSGATESAYEKMQTTTWTLAKAFNEIKNVALEFGNALMSVLSPAIQSFVDMLHNLATWLSSIDEGTKQMIVTVAMVAAAIGPALLVIGKLFTTVSRLMTAVSSLSAVWAGLSTVLGGLVAPVLAIIAVIAALYVAWETDFNGMRDTVSSVFTSIQSIVTSAVTIVQSIISIALDIVTSLWQSNFANIQGIVTAAFGTIQALFESFFTILSDIFAVFANLFTGNWSGLWESIKTLFSDVWTAILSLLANFLNLIVQTIVGIVGGVYEAMMAVGNAIENAFTTAWNSITSWFEGAVQDPIGTLLGITDAIFNAGASVFSAMWDGLKSVWDQLTGWVEECVQWLVDKVTFWESESSKMSSGSSDGSGSRSRNVQGSYASGLDYVPRDMIVKVHEGEEIRTKQQRKEDMENRGGGDTFIFQSPKAIDEVTAAREMRKVKKEIAEDMLK